MIRLPAFVITLLTTATLTTGCWDQRELRNIRMVHTAGVDLLDDQRVRLTVSIPTIKTSIESQGTVVTPKISGEGRSVQEASVDLQKVVSQHMDLREMRVLLVERKFAEKNLYEALDFFYREAHFPINVYIAITESSAQKIVQLEVEDRSLISEYLYDLLLGSEGEGLLPKESPYLISSIMTNQGVDNVLPYLNIKADNNRAKIDGLALLHNKKMTGKLDDLHARTYAILTNHKTYGTMTEPVGPENSYVTLTFQSLNRHIELKTKGGVAATVHVKINCHLIDNPTGAKIDRELLARMSTKLESLLNERAEETIKQLQQANCDGLGFGVRLKALHNQKWKKLDWEQEYPRMRITPKIKVQIVYHGLLN